METSEWDMTRNASVLQLQTTMQDDDLKKYFKEAAGIIDREIQGKNLQNKTFFVIPTIAGYDFDSRELHDIPEAVALAKRAIACGLYGLMTRPALYGCKVQVEFLHEVTPEQQWFMPLMLAYGDKGVLKIAPPVMQRLLEKSCEAFNKLMDMSEEAPTSASEAVANWSRLAGNLYTAHEKNEQRARLIRRGFQGENVEAAHLAMMEVHAEHMARRSAELGQCDLCKKQAELTKKTNAKGTITVYWCETCCENTLDTPPDSDSEPFISLSYTFTFILGNSSNIIL